MANFITKFNTKADFEAAADLQYPNVSLIADTKEIIYTYEKPEKYEYVDLGLPSGTLWAKFNIGATGETDYGLYFQWGDTQGYTREQINNGEKTFNWGSYKWCNGSQNTLTKYNIYSSFGTVDNKTELESTDDAATALWGSSWCMPSSAQCQELFNTAYTTTAWTRNYQGSGVNGMVFTSKQDSSKHIFIPAAGLANDGSVYDVGSYGYVWSRSLYTSAPISARYLYFRSGVASISNDGRYHGVSVRPVRAVPESNA